MDKRTVLAFVLIGIILILTQTDIYKKRVIPKRTIENQYTDFSEDTLKRQEPLENQRISRIDTLRNEYSESKALVGGERENLYEQSLFSGVLNANDREQKLNIVSPLYDAEVSSKGGGITSFKLRKYDTADSQLVEMIPLSKHGLPAIGIVVDRDSILFARWFYNHERENRNFSDNIFLNEENPVFTIRYFLHFQDGKKIEKRYTFYADKYEVDFTVSLNGFSNLSSDLSYQLIWNSSLLPTEKPIRDDLGYYKIYTSMGEDLQDFNVDENENEWQVENIPGIVNWTALRTKYFVSAIAPLNSKGRSLSYQAVGFPYSINQRFKYYKYSINMPLGNDQIQENQYKLYFGPLEYNGLKKLELGFEKLIMRSGGYERLFHPFSIIILKSLKFLHRFISNYGLVIILFSILIKVLLYPLTHKSYVSMKKMQLVQPLMSEMKEKYKNDPKQLNKQTMKLYKDYGVNPLGGCLPMLLQMPLLIGLFIVFRSTIELRGAEFFWWISDLSKPDAIFHLPFSLPLYGDTVGLLPIVMGLTMFLQQKSTMMQDPRQKMMAYFMPIFFVLLFNSFPSGLNLYYTLFNIWTIIQQKFVKTDAIQLKPVEKKPDRKKRGKK